MELCECQELLGAPPTLNPLCAPPITTPSMFIRILFYFDSYAIG